MIWHKKNSKHLQNTEEQKYPTQDIFLAIGATHCRHSRPVPYAPAFIFNE